MKKIFGIPIALFVIALLVVGSGTALLVKYLSNTVTHSVTITSPLEMTGDTALSISVYGGNDIAYSVTTINHADVPVESYPITEITGPEVWWGNEFDSILLADPYGEYSVLPLLYVVKGDGTLIPFSEVSTLDTKTIKVYVDKTGTGTATKYTRGVGFIEQNNITITTNPAITPGAYTIKSCQLQDLLGDC
jgi:hypothetical protein